MTGGNRTPDLEWLPKLGESDLGWVVISGEADIIDVAHERAALVDANLTFFSMDEHWDNAPLAEQAWKIVKLWPEIVRHAEMPGPAIYRVHTGKKHYIDVVKSGMRARGGKHRG